MAAKQGSLTINSENIFPIIKKWLYSDHDIFFRELISNGCDAITKLKKLSMVGEFEEPEENQYRVDIIVSPENKTIQFIDNGLGMTEDEVNEYICQIAFSGAADFLEKYKDKANDDQIIGHFGLGFYSAFMVADKVTIETLSYQEGAEPVYWECDNGTEYTIGKGDRTQRGTVITLYLNEDSYEFANEYRAKEVIQKYCSFMPIEIYFTNADAPEEEIQEEEAPEVLDADGNVVEQEGAEEAEEADAESEDGSEDEEESKDEAQAEKKETKKPQPLNDTTPLWTKHPNDCTEEEYKEFYRKVFMDYREPLFWIHLNMDYPFNLKGILYFPKINLEVENAEGKIKLYNNQVFVADNIKEVIPEFLLLLKGVIDCPDLPLNVSRSALQNDGFVKKISDYITKKVADKLSGMCKTDKENYEKYWDDISPFIKYGCLRDDKFNEKMTDYIIFKNLEDKYVTLPEYLEAGKEKHENQVFYVTDRKEQSQYVNLFQEEGMDAILLTTNIDTPFITHLEQKNQNVHFLRIDSDLSSNFVEETEENEETVKANADKLTEIFRKALGNDKLEVKVQKLKNANVSSMITESEESRRMQDMMRMYSMGGFDPSMFGGAGGITLVLNSGNTLVQYVLEHEEGEHTKTICQQLYDLALLAHKPLEPEAMTKFINRSNEILSILAKE
ncbi:MAG: molecular chaperone HtpG [Bacteroides sp.]|nr:molecular chaperone HtpG [Bacteroides sp.]MCM1549620.1 molecular chaperone HtpG [Clostridium sp.]